MEHLAELNIAQFQYPTDDPRMADFMNNLDRVNALAERSPGFVWRLKGDNNNATVSEACDDTLVNLISVWETPEALEHYVFKTVHVQFYRRRAEWFDADGKARTWCSGGCRRVISPPWRRP